MPKHISTLLPTALPPTNWKVQLLSNWPHIMKNLQDKVQLEHIEEHSLVLGVYHSSWMQELYIMSPLLLEKINQALDIPRIKHLRFKMISIKKKKYIQEPTTYRKSAAPIALSSEEQYALNQIKDEDLKKVLTLFLHRCRDA